MTIFKIFQHLPRRPLAADYEDFDNNSQVERMNDIFFTNEMLMSHLFYIAFSPVKIMKRFKNPSSQIQKIFLLTEKCVMARFILPVSLGRLRWI